MATYVMSDLHGQQDVFNNMLNQIGFSNTDTLYILGDYVDWGDKSIPLIQQIMAMQSDKGYGIECLMGNHDLMMQKVISKTYTLEQDLYEDNDLVLWDYNGGYETLKQYLELDKDEQSRIKIWLNKLRYFIPDVEVSGQKFYLCHSKPYVRGMKFENVVWDRLKAGRLPQQFKAKYPDSILISGHTIVSNLHSFNKEGLCEIYKDKSGKYINIDCGAKVLETRAYGRLACLRLDDMAEFYEKSTNKE